MPGSIGSARFGGRPKYVFRIGVGLVFAEWAYWAVAQNFARVYRGRAEFCADMPLSDGLFVRCRWGYCVL